jgi:hypothetical protein
MEYLRRTLINGIRYNFRFRHLCDSLEFMDDNVIPSYNRLKEKVIEVDLTRSMDRSARTTMLRAITRGNNRDQDGYGGSIVARDKERAAQSGRSTTPSRVHVVGSGDDNKRKSASDNKSTNKNEDAIICWICNLSGHRARVCPQKGKVGHRTTPDKTRPGSLSYKLLIMISTILK